MIEVLFKSVPRSLRSTGRLRGCPGPGILGRGMERDMKDFIFTYRNVALSGWMPAADMYEDDEHVLVFVDLAGVDPDQVRITLENRGLLITGERPRPSRGNVMRIHQMEIDAGTFRRHIPLPTPVDFEKIQCTYRHGLLRISLPKRQQEEAVQIPVESE
jgi:HSP20 family protein